MADNNSTVQFKADISQLRAAMQQAQRQVRLASSEFQKVASAAEKIFRGTAAFLPCGCQGLAGETTGKIGGIGNAAGKTAG
jgi:hypothetical protein